MKGLRLLHARYELRQINEIIKYIAITPVRCAHHSHAVTQWVVAAGFSVQLVAREIGLSLVNRKSLFIPAQHEC